MVFECKTCQFVSNRKHNLEKHCITKKHTDKFFLENARKIQDLLWKIQMKNEKLTEMKQQYEHNKQINTELQKEIKQQKRINKRCESKV